MLALFLSKSIKLEKMGYDPDMRLELFLKKYQKINLQHSFP